MGELLNGTNDMSILLVPSILFFVAAFAFALELTLSLVRVIKNRSFVKQCWSIRFVLWCWRTFIKVCELHPAIRLKEFVGVCTQCIVQWMRGIDDVAYRGSVRVVRLAF